MVDNIKYGEFQPVTEGRYLEETEEPLENSSDEDQPYSYLEKPAKDIDPISNRNKDQQIKSQPFESRDPKFEDADKTGLVKCGTCGELAENGQFCGNCGSFLNIDK